MLLRALLAFLPQNLILWFLSGDHDRLGWRRHNGETVAEVYREYFQIPAED
jgi:hypothetical protein